MNRRDFGHLTLGTLGAAVFATPAAQPAWTSLWNGKDLAGWTTWMRQPDPASDVPGLKRSATEDTPNRSGRGAIRSECSPLRATSMMVPRSGFPGEVFGELRTTRTFTNYHLKLQFKWGDKKWPPRDGATTPRDSGLLYHVHAAAGAEGRTWARSVELQIQEHDVGDLYAIGSAIAVRAKRRAGTQPALYDYDPTGEWTFFSQSQGAPGRCVKQPDNEKPTGEWNSVELVCLGRDCIHIVNGKVVMRLHGPLRIDAAFPTPVTAGQIILQSEGAEVFYREIAMRSITVIPAEFAE